MEKTLNPPLNLCQFSGGCFAAGDLRANEQIVLASMHTLWVYEHNRLAGLLKYINQHWDSEKIFQEARKIVIAQLQHITYDEFLTKFLGKDAIAGIEKTGISVFTSYNHVVNKNGIIRMNHIGRRVFKKYFLNQQATRLK